MKNKILAIFAALVMAFSLMAAPSANALPADAPVVAKVAKAKAWGTSVSHASDDSGYTRDIHVVCNSGKHVYLSPGDDTFLGNSTDACTQSGVDRIVVNYNQTVFCKNYVYPYQDRYFYTGTTYFGSNQTWKCYDQWPL